MNGLQIFENPEFGKVRTVSVEDKVYFVANDVAKALGYTVPKDAVARHCKGALKRRYLTEGGEQEMKIIPEGDIYRLVIKSQLPAAEKFESWIFDEVLPAIRKTGGYITRETSEQIRLEAQKARADAMLQNAKIRSAAMLERIAAQYDGTYKQVLHAHATKELTGEFLLPLPKLERKTFSAGEIGDRLGITANKVGILTNRYGLKTDAYGAWFKDKAKGSNKEVPTFRYYEEIIPILENILQESA